MKITCSECSSHYTMSRGEISALPYSIMDCSTCRQKIKIIICPRCSACYTVTFGAVNSQRYMMTCRKCSHNFVVSFPGVKPGGASPSREAPRTKKAAESGMKPHEKVEIKTRRSGVTFPSHKEESGNRETVKYRPGEDAGSSSVIPDVSMPGSFELSEIIDCITGAFAPSRLGAGFLGLLVMLLSYKIMQMAGMLLQGVPVLGSIAPWIGAGFLFFLYSLIAAGMARGTFEELFFKRQLSFSEMALSMIALTPSLLGASLLVLILLEASLLLFGLIPLVGPLLFALLFLPVYSISLAAVLLISVGFWFYPPLVVHRKTGMGDNAVNFFLFIKKHNLKLLMVIPVLGGFSLVVVMVLFLLHHGALLMSSLIASGILGEKFGTILASVPLSLQTLGDFSSMAHMAGQYGVFLGALVSSESLAGVILGVVMASVTAFLGGITLSVIASLSTYTYLALERGQDPGNRKKAALLGLVILFLLMILLFRRVLGG